MGNKSSHLTPGNNNSNNNNQLVPLATTAVGPSHYNTNFNSHYQAMGNSNSGGAIMAPAQQQPFQAPFQGVPQAMPQIPPPVPIINLVHNPFGFGNIPFTGQQWLTPIGNIGHSFLESYFFLTLLVTFTILLIVWKKNPTLMQEESEDPLIQQKPSWTKLLVLGLVLFFIFTLGASLCHVPLF